MVSTGKMQTTPRRVASVHLDLSDDPDDAPHMSMQDAFLKKIERFLRESGMAETAFGRAVVNDGSLVADLRAGRSPSLRTVERVNEFIAAHKQRAA